MAAKAVVMTGAEFKEFYQDPRVWGNGNWYLEEEHLDINGVDGGFDSFGTIFDDEKLERIEDTDVVKVLEGSLCWQGSGKPQVNDKTCDDWRDFRKEAQKWMEQRSTISLAISVNKDVDMTALAEALKPFLAAPLKLPKAESGAVEPAKAKAPKA